jgi:predicted SnoaL-like aldol condensation-catalyzing enzyme
MFAPHPVAPPSLVSRQRINLAGIAKKRQISDESDVILGMSVKSTLKGRTMSETNKANTVAFHKRAVFEGDVENAFRTYAGSPYRQHNPLIEDDMDGLRKFVAWMGANRPDAHGEIKRVFADGDYVMLHSHWHGLSDNPRGEAVVDIYRLENGKMVEHWDVIQPIPETAANNNTMF